MHKTRLEVRLMRSEKFAAFTQLKCKLFSDYWYKALLANDS